MKRLRSLQYLRALAALAVAAYHARQWSGGGFDIGRAGVDVFFVISGVIMWRVAKGPEARAPVFLWRRMTRVAPLYWLVTLVVAAVALAWPDFMPNVHLSWTHLALSLAFLPHLDPRGLPFPVLPAGWTLTYEAIFYLAFAGALLVPIERRAAVAAAGLFGLVGAGLMLDYPAYYLGANPMLLEFAAGVGLANMADISALPSRVTSLALIAVAVAAFALPALLGVFSEVWRPLIWGAPAAVLVAGALSLELQGGIGRWPVLERLGDASYSLYVVHAPIIALVAHAVGSGHPRLLFILALAASVAAGLACHLWIETPLIAGARGIGRRRGLAPAA